MTSIAFALLAMIGWGVSDMTMKNLSVNFGPYRGIAYRNVFAVLVILIAILIVQPMHAVSLQDFLLAIVIAIFGYFPFMFFTSAMKHGKVGVVVPVSKIWILVAGVVGVVLFSEPVTLVKIVSLAFIFFGVVVVSISYKDFSHSALLSWESGVPLGFISGLLWGLVFALFKYPAGAIGPILFALVVESSVFVSAFIQLKLNGQRFFPSRDEGVIIKTHVRYIVASGVMGGLGTVCINLAYANGDVGIVSAIGGSSVLVSVILSAIIYKEWLSAQQYGGVLLILCGIVATAII